MVVMDLPGRCKAIKEQWIERQRLPLSQYQIEQCDMLSKKLSDAIVEGDHDLYDTLGDFEEAILNGNNGRDTETAAKNSTDYE